MLRLNARRPRGGGLAPAGCACKPLSRGQGIRASAHDGRHLHRRHERTTRSTRWSLRRSSPAASATTSSRPVGAIVNGLEVLEEEKDESMREFAMDLVQKSARQASAKLQFSRLAFGASGGAGAEIDMARRRALRRGADGAREGRARLAGDGRPPAQGAGKAPPQPPHHRAELGGARRQDHASAPSARRARR